MDIQKVIEEIFRAAAQIDVWRFILPQAGVGGAIDVKESIDIVPVLKFTFIFLAGIATVFGLGLAMAAKRFAVKVNPKIEQVKGVLANAHCGACGYAGCEQYAEAVVNDPDVAPNLCTPGGERCAKAVALITGKTAEAREPFYARIMCQGGISNSRKRFIYEGFEDCRAAVLAGGGDKACIYGCLGYGTCVRVCPFDAMHMGENGLPIVDIQKCTGCRKCEAACPKNVIEVLPASKMVLAACHSKDRGADTRKNCDAGCIACGKCVKICPFDAPVIEENFSVIDISKCRVCGLCVPVCPTKAIVDLLPVRTKAFITDKCIGCGICAKVCPVNAVTGEQKKKHLVDSDKCIGCGICVAKCPVQAIDGAFNSAEVNKKAEQKRAVKTA
ncbi:MAG: Fe-S cluster domain-containing protein [Dissulfurispiraceae bacterium]|nr:Fe-S cluster domain-containing protein [Dissulfurispiraceae bacterium]